MSGQHLLAPTAVPLSPTTATFRRAPVGVELRARRCQALVRPGGSADACQPLSHWGHLSPTLLTRTARVPQPSARAQPPRPRQAPWRAMRCVRPRAGAAAASECAAQTLLRLQGTWAADVSPRSVAVLSQADPEVAGGSVLHRTATRAVPSVQLVLKDLPKGVAGAVLAQCTPRSSQLRVAREAAPRLTAPAPRSCLVGFRFGWRRHNQPVRAAVWR